jgi:hypothetical protein
LDYLRRGEKLLPKPQKEYALISGVEERTAEAADNQVYAARDL